MSEAKSLPPVEVSCPVCGFEVPFRPAAETQPGAPPDAILDGAIATCVKCGADVSWCDHPEEESGHPLVDVRDPAWRNAR
jgi:endogenous inhibitor of DNA gyrase (YacG/DUF329 family)